MHRGDRAAEGTEGALSWSFASAFAADNSSGGVGADAGTMPSYNKPVAWQHQNI
jgi:hypothetical protein